MVIEIKHKNKILNIKLEKYNREKNSHNSVIEAQIASTYYNSLIGVSVKAHQQVCYRL